MKNLLFIGVGFHEYDSYIIKKLEKEYNVSYLNCSGFRIRHPYIYSLVKYSSGLFSMLNNKTTKSYIKTTKDKGFDTIFIIKGTNLTDEHFMLLRQYHPSAKLVLYLWDAWELIPNRDVLRRNVSKIYSFDSEDCKKYGFILRPLFYLESCPKTKKQYDICFVGNGHSNRLKLMRDLKRLCVENGLKYRFVVNMGIPAYLKMKYLPNNVQNDDKDIISSRSIPYQEYLEIIRTSRTVVDIHYNKQSGLTMRTIEALAAGARVITTNEHIKEYENIPSNMYLLWKKNADAELMDFVNAPKPEYTISPYYSIEYFLKEVVK